MRRRTVPEGIRITKVGLWFVLLTLVVGVAAANTGNNSLYLVESFLLGVLVLSGVSSRHNLRGIHIELELPEEVYANRPFSGSYRIWNSGRWLPRRMIALSVLEGSAELLPFLERKGQAQGRLELMVPRRGPFLIPHAHLVSLFPMGFFRKGLRIRLDHEMLVFPEIFGAGRSAPQQVGLAGEDSSGQRGWGHELMSLRRFRAGDDRRSIHWKQSARVGQLIFMEREAERGRRLSIVLDNAVGPLESSQEIQRFELLISEAATAAYHYLEQDFQVELVTRHGRVGFGTGKAQRIRIMRELAVLQVVPRSREPLVPEASRIPRLQLAMESKRTA